MRLARVFLLLLGGLLLFSLSSCEEDCIGVTIINNTHGTIEIKGALCGLDRFLNTEIAPLKSKGFSVRPGRLVTANGWAHVFTREGETWVMGYQPP